MTTNERGPRAYVERATETITEFNRNSDEIKDFLALCRQLKKIVDLDTKLEAVIDAITQQYTDPKASDDMRKRATSMLVELTAYVQALEKPEEARNIIFNFITSGIDPARAVVATETFTKRPELRVGMLAESLSEYLDKFIEEEEKAKKEE